MTPFSWKPDSTESILLVDDTAKNFDGVKSVLKHQGYKVTVTNSHCEVLIKIAESPPGLVLLDTFIPNKTGCEITRQIKQNSDLPFIPVLLITNCDESNLIQGLKAGADEFLIAPVEVNELLTRVRLLLRLKHSIDQREAIAHRRWEDFVINLTHDLRTPLTSAIQVLNLLQTGSFGQQLSQMQEYLHQIAENNHTLLDMVENMLEVYQYEAGSKYLEFFAVDLWELIQKVVEELQPLVLVENLNLTTKSNNTYPSAVKVWGDRIELHRLLVNSVGNAIRFTDAGSIEIRLCSTVQCVKIEVEDTVIGISGTE